MIPASYNVRDLTIRPATVLAPMAGVTDTLFRRVIRGLGGCGLLMTEFTSSEGITRSAKKTLRYLFFQEDEHPITAQLFGADPRVMAEASKMVEDLGYDAVDINLGCPAKKVVKCGGSGLLRDMPLLEQIFRAVRAAVKIPLHADIPSRPSIAPGMATINMHLARAARFALCVAIAAGFDPHLSMIVLRDPPAIFPRERRRRRGQTKGQRCGCESLDTQHKSPHWVKSSGFSFNSRTEG